MKSMMFMSLFVTLLLGIPHGCSSDPGPDSQESDTAMTTEAPRAEEAAVAEPEVEAEDMVEEPAAEEPARTVARTTERTQPQEKPKAPTPGKKPARPSLPTGSMGMGAQDKGEFADFAFPPTIPDTDWHQNAWRKDDCMRCHETGVGEAPEVIHRDMPHILKEAKCRTCHVIIPGEGPSKKSKIVHPEDKGFADFAFPPVDLAP